MSKLQKAKETALLIVFGIDPASRKVEVDDSQFDEQDSTGAPVEKESPLGYEASSWTIVYLIIQGVIGTGIFGTPASVLNSVGSIGASYIFWVLGYVITLFQISAYIEFVTYFRRRSGGEVVYLEQSFPRPQFLIPVVYAAVTVILSFATSSASAFASYLFKAAEHTPTDWEQRGLAVLPLIVCAAITALNTKFAVRLNNFIGFVKVVFVVFLAISGLVVLGGKTRVGNTHSVFANSWEGTTTDGNSISNAILKVVFSYGGSGYAFGVVAETVPTNTIRAYKRYVPATMTFIFVLYILITTAYYAGIGDVAEIKKSKTLIAAVYFENVFGTKASVAALCAFVAISSFGHLLGVFISHSRALRECGRQGMLPYPKLWTSVKPFGTPLFPVVIILTVNIIVLLAPPPGDAYNFVVDMGSYKSYIFNALLFIGLVKLRIIRKKLGLGYKEFHIWTPLLWIAILWTFFVLGMAFVPPKGTLIGADISFFYATAPLTTIGLIFLCIGYYFVWAFVLPRYGKYKYRLQLFLLGTGELGHTIVKVPNDQVDEWDAEHGAIETTEDELGNLVLRDQASVSTGKKSNVVVTEARI